ncbi:MAG TPA: hypothetical protein ENH91_05980 [Leeuwenhoekiella sp.]|nr:hypothetical protein [Leeuwenhoekiella sp.]
MALIFKMIGILVLFCTTIFPSNAQELNPLHQILDAKKPEISRVMDSLPDHALQIRYTHISRDSKGNRSFKTYDFQTDDANYFYPASTVKLPVAVLALEHMVGKELKNGTRVNLDTPYQIKGDTLTSSLRKDIEAIFAVSDNEAYNRLYELLGRDSINAYLKNKALEPLQIVHRLSTPNAAEAKTRDVVFYPESKKTVTRNGYTSTAIRKLQLKGIQKGKGFMQNDSLISGAFDFSSKNYYPVSTQQELMKRLLFPQEYLKSERFVLDKKTRRFLLRTMHKMPRQLGYDDSHYQDSYGKFFMYGDRKNRIPSHIQIFNKVGYAYGTLTDNAYIKDKKNNIEFLLTVTILVNKNQIFNDNRYEFDSVGIPFLAELGRQVYSYEQAIRQKDRKK